MTIHDWLKRSSDILADEMFTSPRLDAEIILAHTIREPRSWLHAHNDESLNARQEEIANARLDLRLDHVPIAYIVGHKEFYGRQFEVTPHVLIPRPESEALITELLQVVVDTATKNPRIVDIGTGSGCLGITAKLELPETNVTLLDVSPGALNIAQKNADRLAADIQILKSDLLDNYPYTPDIALANLPYVDPSWEQSAELRHEPVDALYAKSQGLSVIRRCLSQLSIAMKAGGVAIFEADPRQETDLTQLADTYEFSSLRAESFCYSFVKR